MAYKKFSDFVVFDPPDITDYLVGYRELGGEYRASLQSVTDVFKKYTAPILPHTLFVNTSGNDSELGISESYAFRTIKRAMAKALELANDKSEASRNFESEYGWGTEPTSVNIFVRAGDYYEDNPIYVPPGVTIVSESVGSVTIRPKNKFYDIFWVNNETSIQGITFRDYYSPACAIAYPEFFYLNNKITGNYPSTRIAEATARAYNYYQEDSVKYPTTRISKASDLNLTNDVGTPIFDPFKISFLGRYYSNFRGNDIFYTQEETITQRQFWQTEYYNLSTSIQRPYVLKSPYVINCSTITNPISSDTYDAGGSLHVNGNAVDGPLRSITLESCESINQGGRAIQAVNNGVANVIDNTTYYCTESIMASNGGICLVNGTTCSYGLSGLVSIGKSTKATMLGTLKNDVLSGIPTNIFTITDLGSPDLSAYQQFPEYKNPYVGQIFEIVDYDYSLVSTGLNYLTARNSGTFFVVQSASELRPASFPYKGYECDIVIEGSYLVNEDTSITENAYIPPQVEGLFRGSSVLFYIQSKIVASSQQFNHIGTGTNFLSAIPQTGVFGIAEKEVNHDGVGRIVYDSNNQSGITNFGDEINLNQINGTIEANNLILNKNFAVSGVSNFNVINASSANIDVLNIKQYEISGFKVTGDLTVYGNISASENLYGNNITITNNLTASGNSVFNTIDVLSANIDVLNIKQYEVSGFKVTGDLTVFGNISASNAIHSLSSFTDDSKISNALYTNNIFSNNLSATNSIYANDIFTINLSAYNSTYSNNTFTSNLSVNRSVIVDASTNNAALLITQNGNGDALVVRDEVNDSTPFVVTSAGRVGIGTSDPAFDLTIIGDISASGRYYGLGTYLTGVTSMVPWGYYLPLSGGDLYGPASITTNSYGDAFKITQTGPGFAFTVEDESSPDNTPFIINSVGDVGVGTYLPPEKLSVVGNISASQIIKDGNGDSSQWNSVYTSVKDTSANWNSVYNTVNPVSADWNSVYTSVKDTSANWNSVYTNVNTNSANYTTFNYVDGKFFPLSGGLITGPTRFNSNVTIYGNLTATGTSYFANTIYSTTSALSVLHDGSGAALFVGSRGAGDIASFYDTDQDVEVFHIGGANGTYPNVGVNTSTPNKDFTVNGEISANNNIWTSGNFISAGKELLSIIYPDINKGLGSYTTVRVNSANWESVYNTVSSVSANWNSVYTSTKNTSGNWNSVYTNVNTNSANLQSTYLTLSTLSGNWNSVYTSVKDTSGNWNSVYTSVKDTSGNWNSVYTSTKNTSANWNSVYTSVNVTSGNWNSVYNSVNSVSGNWNSVYTSVNVTSSNWDSVYDLVNPLSGNWNSVYASVNSVSGNWNSVYTNVKDTSANWNSVYTTVNTNSANGASVYNTINPLSANWNSVYTSTKNTSANWNSVYNTVNPVSANWNSVYTSVKDTSANWNSTYSSVNSVSGNWDSVYDLVNPLSANWNSVYTSVNVTSSNWDSVYDLVNPLSANWNSVYTSVKDTSGNWNSVYTTVNTNSANGGSVYNSVNSLSANWNSVYSSVNSVSANWNSVYTSVKDTSANWNSVYTSVKDTSANWNSVYTSVNVTSGSWNSVYDLVNPLSGNWNSVYSNVNANSASYATISYSDSKYFPITGGIITGPSKVQGNFTVYGDLSATGTSYFSNTVYSTTSALSVINIGNTGAALYVANDGTGDIASFYDMDQDVEVLHVGGSNGTYPNVGIKTSMPNKDFTVNGEISANNNIWTSGNFISAGKELLSIIYPDINNGLSVFTSVKNTSANWNSVYTTVNTNSANGGSVYNTVNSLSGNWNSVYTTVNTNSANGGSVYNSVNSLSSNWNSVYTTVNTNSASFATIDFANSKFLQLSGGNLTGSCTLSTFSSNDALRITQSGSGNAIVIEDSENPDSNPFVITNTGSVGIGTSIPNQKLTVSGSISASGIISASASDINVNIVNVSSDIVFTNDYNNKVVHFDTTTSPLCAIFPSSLNSGFNVAIMNIGTNNLILSAANLKSAGTIITTQYGGAFVYKELNNIFAVGRLV